MTRLSFAQKAQPASVTFSIPAPVGGLNARDGLAQMPPTDAVKLENWFPTPSTVDLRGGSSVWATGLNGNVESLMMYGGLTRNKLLAASGTSIYDVSATGAVGAALWTGLTNARWQHVNFGSTAANGQFLIMVNGVDLPLIYNGTQVQVAATTATAQTISSITRVGTLATLTTAANHGLVTGNVVTISGTTPAGFSGTYRITVTSPTTFTYVMAADPGGNATVVGTYVVIFGITGVDPHLFIQGVSFKQRLYFVEKDSFRCWYLPVNSIGGAAQSLEFGGMFKLGGALMAVATWSVDNAAGIQEYFVAISTLGEVVVYQGFDPTSAANWSIAYHFRIGRPIGRRCYAKLGSDLVFITADGAFPLSKGLLTDRYQTDQALSAKIQNLINADVQAFNANFGWQIILYPIGNKVIVNVPQFEDNISYQYVMNTITRSWTKFTGWNAYCWELYNDQIFFGTLNTVYQADVGYSDAGNAIPCEALQAFNYFGASQQKFFTMMRPVLFGTTGLSPACLMNVDFDTTTAPQVTSVTNGGFTLWGSPWGSPWTTPNSTVRGWHNASGLGYAGAPHIAMSVMGTVCKWQSTDVVYQQGGTL